MKKLHLVFGIVAGVITLVALVIASIWYVSILRSSLPSNPSSIPPEAAFEIVGVVYALVVGVWGIAWLTAWLILRRGACKKQSGVL